MKLFRIALGAVVGLLLCVTAGDAQRSGAGKVDPSYLGPLLDPTSYGQTNQDTKVVALRSAQTLNPAVRNLVLIAAGQSNIANVAPSAFSPVNAGSIDCFNAYDGAIYAAADPLLAATSLVGSISLGHPALRMADALVTAGKFDRVVIVPIAIGGTNSAYWAGIGLTRIPITLSRLADRGIVEGANVTIAVAWGQGESDNFGGVSQSTYVANVTAVINATRTAGFAGRWFIAKETYINGTVSATIQAAQAALVDHGANIWAGPDADSLVGNVCSGVACRRADLTHWTDNGSASYATLYVAALAASGAPF